MDIDSLPKLKVDELKAILKEKSVAFGSKDKKADLISKLRDVLLQEADEAKKEVDTAADINQCNHTLDDTAPGADVVTTTESEAASTHSNSITTADEIKVTEVDNSTNEAGKSPNPADEKESVESTKNTTLHETATAPAFAKPNTETHTVDSSVLEENRLRELVLRQQLTARVRSSKPATDVPVGPSPVIVSAPGKEPTRNVRIDNFQRPWQLRTFQAYLAEQLDTIIEDAQIWVNNIKTHVYVTLSSVDEASKCIDFVSGKRYPETSTMLLIGNYTDVSAQEAPASLEAQAKPGEWQKLNGKLAAHGSSPHRPDTNTPSPRSQNFTGVSESMNRLGGGLLRKAVVDAADSAKSAPLLGTGTDRLRQSRDIKDRIGEPVKRKLSEDDVEIPLETENGPGTPASKRTRLPGKAVAKAVDEEEVVTLDDLFKKTDAAPSLYWLPVSNEEAARRKSLNEKYLGDLGSANKTVAELSADSQEPRHSKIFSNNGAAGAHVRNTTKWGSDRFDRPNDVRPPSYRENGPDREREMRQTGRGNRNSGPSSSWRDRSRDRVGGGRDGDRRDNMQPELAKYGPPPRR
jgi:apoptotic chromatin condensation inducer in the nucleus